ncbi:MAG: S8 family serine peptidase [Dehalococcoidia bacterium]|nr:S8 family serine peptidase [Dehalococcoidia bacterium]
MHQKKLPPENIPLSQWANPLLRRLAASLAHVIPPKANGPSRPLNLLCISFVACALLGTFLVTPSADELSGNADATTQVRLHLPSVLLHLDWIPAPMADESDCSGVSSVASSKHCYTPKDIQRVNQLWGAERIHTVAAWQTAGPLCPVLVAILDTGIDTSNSLLKAREKDSIVLAGSSGPTDLYGHGTHIAGTVACIAPGAQLLNVKVADDRGYCDSSTVALGIRHAVSRGAAVINLSLEVEHSPELESAIRHAWREGAVVVAAAGNHVPAARGTLSPDGDAATSDAELVAESTLPLPCSTMCTLNTPNGRKPEHNVYPASYVDTIAVTGTMQDDSLAPSSNRASWVDVAAPGFRIPGYLPGETCGYLTGTSTAAAHVSGVAALLCGMVIDSSGNGFVNDEVRFAVETSCTPLPVDNIGHGLLDARAAVDILRALNAAA